MLEKVSADEAARVRLGLRFSLGTVLDKQDKIIEKMLENAETKAPEQLKFKGTLTDVYLHKLTLKDSIWFMWENKVETGPRFDPASAAE